MPCPGCGSERGTRLPLRCPPAVDWSMERRSCFINSGPMYPCPTEQEADMLEQLSLTTFELNLILWLWFANKRCQQCFSIDNHSYWTMVWVSKVAIVIVLQIL